MQVVLNVVLTVALLVLVGVAVWAVFVLVRTLRATEALVRDMDERLVPLLDSMSVTVDAVNAELLRIDGIVDRFEQVSETVSSTTRVAQAVMDAPMEKLVEVRGRVGRLVTTLLGNNRK